MNEQRTNPESEEGLERIREKNNQRERGTPEQPAPEDTTKPRAGREDDAQEADGRK